MTSSYTKLKQYYSDINNLMKVKYILEWDGEVMMPPNATDERAQMSASLEAVLHTKNKKPQVGKWISDALETETDPIDRRNLQLMADNYKLAKAIPESLVRKLTETQNLCQDIWGKAKKDNDWKRVEPYLQKLFYLTKQQGDIYGQVLNKSAYDALLHTHSSGNNVVLIDGLFSELKDALPPLLTEITEKQRGLKPYPFTISLDDQRRLTRRVIESTGYSFDGGRLDEAAHPFSSSTKHDGRITTHYSTEYPFSGLTKGLHESGHAHYSKNAPEGGQPVCNVDRDMILHESQSLLWEKQVGYGYPFIQYLHSVMQEEGLVTTETEADIRSNLHRVKPGLLRLEADEVTYPMHIITRFDIEKGLFNGDIAVADIPSVWNQSMKKILGIDVPDDRRGCLQDIHWYGGLFGYFPTYTQGAVYAAQIFSTIKQAIPDVTGQIAAGDFKPMMGWLKENIHQQGRIYDAPELIKNATGEAPSAKYLLNHLRERYAQP